MPQDALCELRRIILPSGCSIVLSGGSVLDFKGDACVNAANEGCVGGGGVDGAINRSEMLKGLFVQLIQSFARGRSGGPALKRARERLGGCPTGEARFTPSFGHTNTRIIIHAVRR